MFGKKHNKAYYIKKCDNKYLRQKFFNIRLNNLQKKYNRIKLIYNTLYNKVNDDYYRLLSDMDNRIVPNMKNDFIKQSHSIIKEKIVEHIKILNNHIETLIGDLNLKQTFFEEFIKNELKKNKRL